MSESFLASRRAMEPLRVGDLALAHSSGRHGPQSQDEQPRNLLGSRFHERHRGPERTATTGPSPRYLRISNRAAPPTTTAPCSRPTGVRTRTSPFSPRAQERLLEPVAPGGRLRAGRGIPGVPRAWSVGARSHKPRSLRCLCGRMQCSMRVESRRYSSGGSDVLKSGAPCLQPRHARQSSPGCCPFRLQSRRSALPA
jgi:hypothetical protein